VLARVALLASLAGCSLLVPVDDLTGGAQTIATADRPLGIAVAGDAVYWATTASGLWTASKDGSGRRRVDRPADLVASPFDVAADATSIYWSEAGQVFKRPLDGTGAKQSALVVGSRTRFLALAGPEFFVTDAPMSGGAIVSSKGGVIYNEHDAIGGLDAQDGALVWARGTGAIVSGPTTGGPMVNTFASVTGVPGGLAVSGTDAYVIVDQRRLVRLSRNGGDPVPLHEAAQPFGDGDVALDDRFVYWTERDTGLVRRMPR
jgi:hypothetical protein